MSGDLSRTSALRRAAIGALVLMACTTERAPSEREQARTGTVAQPILDGSEDTADRFAVGVCHGAKGSCDGTCSGALILPNVVATARHCVDEPPAKTTCTDPDGGIPMFGPRQSGSFFVTTNASTFSPTTSGWYDVKSIHVPDDARFCGNDIALLVLATPVPASEAVPATPGVQYAMWDPQYSTTYSAIGYGRTKPDSVQTLYGTRRRIDDVGILCIPGSDTRPCADPQPNPSEFYGGKGLCAGDSGSSAFEKNTLTRGAPVSLGVMSRGDVNCEGSVYVRFDAHRDFVLDVAKLASSSWTMYPEPPWTVPKPWPTKKDAGAPPLDLGGRCTAPTDCKSNVCADTGAGGKICSVQCDPRAPPEKACPDGFACRNAFCLRASSVVAQDPGDGGGCSLARRASAPGDAASVSLGVVAVIASVLRRRRIERGRRPS